jgi:hypothetical protein
MLIPSFRFLENKLSTNSDISNLISLDGNFHSLGIRYLGTYLNNYLSTIYILDKSSVKEKWRLVRK